MTAALSGARLPETIETHGGPGGHTAIVAKAQEIPAIVGVGRFLTDVSAGEQVIVEGVQRARPGMTVQTQPWTESYRRLQAAQATCALSGTSSVERGLRALLNPDDAARLALAAWENSSASSEVLNRVLDLIRQTIDAPGVA